MYQGLYHEPTMGELLQMDTDSTCAVDWPVYWMVFLHGAVAEGNYEKAAQAQAELRRLGYECTLRVIPRATLTEPAHV